MTLVLMFFVYAFLGWILEVAFYLFKYRKFVNRGVIYGPLVPIYGLSALAMHGLVYRYFELDFTSISILHIAIVFVLISAVTSLLEVIGGSLLYQLFKARWWDYSSERFNFKGFVSLKYSLIWGVMGTIVFIFVHIPYIYPYLNEIPPVFKNNVVYILSAYLMIDTVVTVFMLFDFKTRIILIRSRLEKLLVNTESYMKNTKGSQIANAKLTLRSLLYALRNNRPMGEVRSRMDILKRYLGSDSDNQAKQEYGKIRSLVMKLSSRHVTKGFPNLRINLKDTSEEDTGTSGKSQTKDKTNE